MRKFTIIFMLFFALIIFSYTIRVGDTISIEVFNYPNLSRTVKVALDGSIPYPYAGNIKVQGKTPDEVAEMLRPYIEKFVKQPVITVYVVEYAPMLVFLQGAINKIFDISTYPDMTITKLFSFLSISKDSGVDFENIQIRRDNTTITVNLLPYFYQGKFDNDIVLKEGDIIYLPPLSSEKTIKILGAYTLETTYVPGLTLSTLLLKLGPIDKEYAEIENTKIYQNGVVNSINLEDVISGTKDYPLSPGIRIYIPKRKEKYAYIIGFVKNPGVKTFGVNEELTLNTLIAKSGGISENERKFIEKIIVSLPNGKELQYSPEVLNTKEKIYLQSGSIVKIVKYPDFYVYVLGNSKIKGKIEFTPDEVKTLKVLLAKIGLDDEVEHDGKVVINNDFVIDIKSVIFGNEDYNLKSGDIVQIVYEPFVVNVVGPNGGSIKLSYNEPKTLPYLIKRLGIKEPKEIEKVLIVRNKAIETYDINTLIYQNPDITLEKFDTIVIKTAETNAVYLTGDVAKYIVFDYNEPITLQRILAKAGLSDYRQIETISVNGKTLNVKENIIIEKGSILNVKLKKTIYVTAMGYIKQTGRVAFEYYETPDLKTLFGKLGGLIIGPDLYYSSDKVYILRNGKIIKEFDAEKVYLGEENTILQDNDFVFVTERQPNYVYVFGKNMPNTIVQFKNNEAFDFKTLLAKINGIPKGISKTVTIIEDSTKVSFTWDETKNLQLKNGSTIIFDLDTENYVYAMDALGKPEVIYLDKDKVTLYEILTKLGIDKNYKYVKLLRNSEEKIIDISKVEDTLAFNVKPGDIIKVVDTPQNFAYILGEVKNPGIVQLHEGTTVLEAIISAGFFTQNAAPSSIFLYKDGINGNAIKVNLSGAVKGGNITENPIVEPGDIIFVPNDPLRTAIDWIPTISSMLNLVNNSILLLNNLSGQ
ncbi:SLBB domain-containing protein [Thermosipho atlanticus]|uniref:Protein involved in polysaccharide export, contains SLBB domain of the beta-grasp fold n=1 Tax=Thermosipho atlanticus DSM 15807 TaxID=1123380 RepID=A0A1M5RQB3_9BACT|nr:polysaccharide biosynthesis/export family protein [Thermosipho atlanticus]SHH28495.1 protein involved in polysaccharide export, contains SLBB domain of the beta-grasp fold [Thermosipho atlanticus DSM 15807]